MFIILVISLVGTNMEEAVQILAKSGLPITPEQDLGEAAKKAVSSLSA